MKLTWSNFEDITKRQNLTPILKKDFNGITVAIAEGRRQPDDKMDVPYWITTYAVFRGDVMDMVQCIRVPVWINHPKHPTFPSQQNTRVELALEEAKAWVDTNLQTERY